MLSRAFFGASAPAGPAPSEGSMTAPDVRKKVAAAAGPQDDALGQWLGNVGVVAVAVGVGQSLWSAGHATAEVVGTVAEVVGSVAEVAGTVIGFAGTVVEVAGSVVEVAGTVAEVVAGVLD